MFSDEITSTDAFLDMPKGSQLLYFHLGMNADDDGFIASPKMVMRVIGASDDELKVLFSKKFLLPFDSGVCVVKHWRINNQIRKDRYRETKYLKEKRGLYIRANGSYTFNSEDALPVPDGHFLPSGNHLATNGQPSIGKVRLGKVRLDNTVPEKKPKKKTKTKKFKKPKVSEIEEYCKERKNNVDSEKFYNYYESKGWLVGKSPMKNWKAAVRTWEKNSFDAKPQVTAKKGKYGNL